MKLLSIFSIVFFYMCSQSYAYEMPSHVSLKSLSVSHTSFDFNTDVDRGSMRLRVGGMARVGAVGRSGRTRGTR